MPEKIQPTPRRERIAIAGATGRVGSALTSLLASDPVDIVALTRRPDAAQPPNGVTIAAIDFDRPYTLQEALRGADRLFVSHGSSRVRKSRRSLRGLSDGASGLVVDDHRREGSDRGGRR